MHYFAHDCRSNQILVLERNLKSEYMYTSCNSSMSQTLWRSYVLDLLPAITDGKLQMFIKPMENNHVSWTTYINMFTIELWGTLILVAMIISCFLTSIEKTFDVKDQFSYMNYLENLWLAFKANFGGKPSSIHRSSSYKIIIFYCLLGGSIVWIAYRAEIVSQLSVIKVKMPFDNLEDLLNSNYRQVIFVLNLFSFLVRIF